jgi:Galactose oxidase, central domain
MTPRDPCRWRRPRSFNLSLAAFALVVGVVGTLVASGIVGVTGAPHGGILGLGRSSTGQLGTTPGGTRALPSSAVGQSATVNATQLWTNLSGDGVAAPDPRAAPLAAYSPTLNETILFGGYNLSGVGTSAAAYGDTWEFSHDAWTLVQAGGSPMAPPPRWGGGLVYDASDGYLLMFGGRTSPNGSVESLSWFLNDTWAYNATGWHQIVTSTAPSPRVYFGMTYDAADGVVVLFGGGIGTTDVPWTIYGDTWTYHAGVWTNITASAGPSPAPRLVGAMAYDAADGYVVLVAGSDSREFYDVSCPYVYPDEWKFVGGKWSPLSLESAVEPPGGFGSMWYDAGSDSLLYYDGIENLSVADCDAEVGNVWMYANGVWQLAWAVGDGAGPVPRYLAAGLDDQGENQSILFGGYYSWYSGPAYNDTWALSVVLATYNLTVNETGLPDGTAWSVELKNDPSALDPLLQVAAPSSIVIRVTDGTYRYLVPTAAGYAPTESTGLIDVVGRQALLNVSFVKSTPSGGAGPAVPLSWPYIAGGCALGAVAALGFLAVADRRLNERRRAQKIVEKLRSRRRRGG